MLKFNQRIQLPVLFPKPCNCEAEVYAADIKKAISFYHLNTIFFQMACEADHISSQEIQRYSHLHTEKG